MRNNPPEVLSPAVMTRRRFLWITAGSAAGFALGCAVNPVTGERQLMLVSEQQEIAIDRQHSPHQFSADYGPVQDERLNGYINGVGQRLVGHTHRRQMPYSFRAVNATYINAYAFPGGSIALTRGILLKLENEAELAGLLGHELGHVNARHTAEQMSKGQLTSLVVAGVSAAVAKKNETYGKLATQLGALGGQMLLAFYSREDERQADSLGNAYMVKAGYNTGGFVGLMEMLNSLHSQKPNAAAVLFSTHPMSDERYKDALMRFQGEYAASGNFPLNRERYMDQTARLRAIRGAITAMQEGEALLAQKKISQAEQRFAQALRQAPNDYAGLLLMAQCQYVQNRADAALRYARKAAQVYPGEARAQMISGLCRMKQNDFDKAFEAFARYEQILPGNPDITFLQGLASEKTGRKERAAQAYMKYLKMVNEGKQAQHAYQRLKAWGYIRS